MVAFIQGTVAGLSETSAQIDVGGIGFEVQVSGQTLSRLSGAGRETAVKLYTYLYVREDAMVLYGFLTGDELALFKKLITVSGIGPKGGLSLLSTFTADELRFAILTGDVKSISRATGIGKRTAERLIIDLRGKLETESAGSAAVLSSVSASDLNMAGPEGTGAAGEAADALAALGYSRAEALKAVQQAAASLGNEENADTETLLKAALRYM